MKNKRVVFSQKEKDEIVSLSKRGDTPSEISKILNRNIGSIYCLLRKNNLKLNKKKKIAKNRKNEIGNRYGSVLVISDLPSNGKVSMWKIKCDCGNETTARGPDLRLGRIKTCGCRKSIVSRRNWKGYGNITKSYWRTCCKNAEQRSLEFSISIQYINELFIKQNKKCALSGIDIKLQPCKECTASLDRIDSSKGYITGNVQWVHKDINFMKSNYNLDYFIQMCKRVANENK